MDGRESSIDKCVAFGEFLLNLSSERLYKNGEEIKVEPQLFACLALLISRPSQIITREEIQDKVWAGRHVSDEAVRSAFKKLRAVLGDNARSPHYIKTIPKQGYKLVSQTNWLNSDTNTIQHENPPTHKPFLSQYFHNIIYLISVCALLAGFMWWQQAFVAKGNNAVPADFEITKLTELAGSEIYASYHPKTSKIAFSHRGESNAPQQIFIKNLQNNQLHKLSWDEAHYTDVHWSKNGGRLAFTRMIAGNVKNIIVDVGEKGNILGQSELNGSMFDDKYVVGWSGDNVLYLAQQGYSNSNRSIYKVHLPTGQLSKVTSPKVNGSGDFLVAESINGQNLAIVREVAKREFSLLVINIQSGSLLANRVLPIIPNRLIWHNDNTGLTISSFEGEAIKLDIEKNTLSRIPKLPPYTNDIFAECGDQCYFMRQHNGNYQDIQEQPNPFSQEASVDNQDKVPNLIASEFLALPGAQYLPTYSKNAKSIYFATYIDEALLIERIVIGEEKQILACWPPTTKLESLRINENETYLAAVADNRLIVQAINNDQCFQQSDSDTSTYKVAVNQPNFITSALEKVSNPYWHADNNSLFLTVFENNTPVVVKLNVKRNHRSKISEHYVAYRPFDGIQGFNAIAVDNDLITWLIKEQGASTQENVKLAQFESDNSHRWAINNHGLYFTSRLGRQAILKFLPFDEINYDLTEDFQNISSSTIGNNRFRLSFDLHPTKNKMLLVESLSAESDLVKVKWGIN
ncbi:winged helix-turn-helix domain-containing protein [Thalassotalea maritima]|uniref:winged helix-turn-helix domain-containing protein n=1 Tax=Thalassotalea maritima TaxID=3242416 RepID=UPI0035273114